MRTFLMRLNKQQLVGVYILLILAVFAVLEGLFGHGNPALQNLDNTFADPSWQEPFGTDQLGRSMLARMGAAMRLSMVLGVMCVASSALIGLALGVIAGWREGFLDRTLNFFVNMLLSLPGLVLILLLASLAPGSFIMLYVAISLVLWVEYFRVVRAITRTVAESAAVQASRMLGFSFFYCFKRHIWPAAMPAMLTLMAFGAANSILAMASLGFVSVGLRPPTAELGLMMVELFPYYSDAPLVLAQPLFAVFLMILAFNMIAGRLK